MIMEDNFKKWLYTQQNEATRLSQLYAKAGQPETSAMYEGQFRAYAETLNLLWKDEEDGAASTEGERPNPYCHKCDSDICQPDQHDLLCDQCNERRATDDFGMCQECESKRIASAVCGTVEAATKNMTNTIQNALDWFRDNDISAYADYSGSNEPTIYVQVADTDLEITSDEVKYRAELQMEVQSL